jgi:hypothetical protein
MVTEFVLWLYDLATEYPQGDKAHRERLKEICEFYDLLLEQKRLKREIKELDKQMVQEKVKIGDLKSQIAVLAAIKEGKIGRG